MMNPLKMAEMLSQASKMKDEMQQKLEQIVVEGSSGGGAVSTTMNGKKQLLKLHIDPSAVMSLSASKADVEMLEDLIVAAVNDAGRRAEDAMQANAKSLLGGLNIPGLG
jgi:nucleoid-associated protein EbfC